jgi:beta-glucosidase/6-phospho-beta-glucosidase/beta-galactosidase
MEISKYINKVATENKEIFCTITIEQNFSWQELTKLCNMSISKENLIVAWSLIIDAILEKYKNEKTIDFIPFEVIEFLIDNNICLIDLGHLKLPVEYLQKIYDKDNECWEALENIKK